MSHVAKSPDSQACSSPELPRSVLLLRTILQLCPIGSSTQLLLAYEPRADEDRRFLQEDGRGLRTGERAEVIA